MIPCLYSQLFGFGAVERERGLGGGGGVAGAGDAQTSGVLKVPEGASPVGLSPMLSSVRPEGRRRVVLRFREMNPSLPGAYRSGPEARSARNLRPVQIRGLIQ